MLTYGIPPEFGGGVHSFIPSADIGSVPSFLGHTIAYRWRSAPRVRRHRTSSPRAGAALSDTVYHHTHIHTFFLRLSFTTPISAWNQYSCISAPAESFVGDQHLCPPHLKLFQRVKSFPNSWAGDSFATIFPNISGGIINQRGTTMYGHTYSTSMDQPGKVASPARGQLNRKNEYFPVRVRA